MQQSIIHKFTFARKHATPVNQNSIIFNRLAILKILPNAVVATRKASFLDTLLPHTHQMATTSTS